jgi:hypothetical protein
MGLAPKDVIFSRCAEIPEFDIDTAVSASALAFWDFAVSVLSLKN